MTPPRGLYLVRRARLALPEMRAGSDLAVVIREKLAADRLPRQISQPAKRARGADQPCSACDLTISQADARYELESYGGARRGGATYRLHVGCYAGWAVECRQQGWRGWRTRRSA